MDIYALERLPRRELYAALRQANPQMFELALQYLEAHVRNYRAPSISKTIWKSIRRFELSESQLKRLEDVALSYLHQPMGREFKPMCLTMAQIATEEFWSEVKQSLESDDLRVQINAYCLYPYSEGVHIGERQRIELKSIKRQLRANAIRRGRAPWAPYLSGEGLLDLLYEPDNWEEGHVVELDKPRQVEIYGPDWRINQELLKLDYAAMRPATMLPKLQQVLQTGDLIKYGYKSWFYAIYIMGRLQDERAVPILIEFLLKIDHKFDGPFKLHLKQRALAVLERLDTVEAKQAIVAYRQNK